MDNYRHFIFFFLTDTATTEIYTLSLHDALPISHPPAHHGKLCDAVIVPHIRDELLMQRNRQRSEEHTSELQSPYDLVCRLLLEKKKNRCIACGPRYSKRSPLASCCPSISAPSSP